MHDADAFKFILQGMISGGRDKGGGTRLDLVPFRPLMMVWIPLIYWAWKEGRMGK